MSSIWPNTIYKPRIKPSESVLTHSKLKRFWKYQEKVYVKTLSSYRICKILKINEVKLFSLSFPTKMLFPNIGLCQCWLFWWWEAVLIYLTGFGVIVACVDNSTSPLGWTLLKV